MIIIFIAAGALPAACFLQLCPQWVCRTSQAAVQFAWTKVVMAIDTIPSATFCGGDTQRDLLMCLQVQSLFIVSRCVDARGGRGLRSLDHSSEERMWRGSATPPAKTRGDDNVGQGPAEWPAAPG